MAKPRISLRRSKLHTSGPLLTHPQQRAASLVISLPLFRPASEINPHAIVSPLQSIELVQTVICATMSTVMFYRGIFPESCFTKRAYDSENPDCSYDTFMGKIPDGLVSGVELITQRHRDGKIFDFNILARDKHADIDKFLDWLESGVGEALKLKYLATMELGFFVDSVAPNNLVEAWKMNFTYQSGPDDGLAMDISFGAAGAAVAVYTAKEQIGSLTRRIVDLMQGRSLPARRKVSIYLTYNSTCPEYYNPPGFKPCEDANFSRSGSEDINVGSWATGHHDVNIAFLPSKLVHISSATDEFSPPTKGVVRTGSNSLTTGQNTTMSLISRTRINQRISPVTPDIMSICDTQERNQVEEISRMAIVRNVTNGGIDTQLLDSAVSPPSNLWGTTSPLPSGEVHKVRQLKRDIVNATILRGQRGVLGDAVSTINPHDNAFNVQCECGVETDFGVKHDSTLLCEVCRTSQHQHCYGYSDADRVLSPHICYTCFLHDDQSILFEMRDLCFLRRALWILYSHEDDQGGYQWSVHGFAMKMGRAATGVSAIETMKVQLMNEGFIQEVEHIKRSSKGHPRQKDFVYVNNLQQRILLGSQYFNPTFKLDDYFEEIPDTGLLPKAAYIVRPRVESVDFDEHISNSSLAASSTQGSPSIRDLTLGLSPELTQRHVPTTRRQRPQTPPQNASCGDGRKRRAVQNVEEAHRSSRICKGSLVNSPFTS